MKIHPSFQRIPDQAMALACSQAFTEFGRYKFKYDPTEGGEGFFPEYPSIVHSVLASYISITPQGIMTNTKFAGLEGEDRSGEIVDLYQAQIGDLQDKVVPLVLLMRSMPGFIEEHKSLKDYVLSTVADEGSLLVAAHVVARRIKDDVLTDALCYPTSLKDGFSSMTRDAITTEVAYLDNLPKEEATAEDEALREGLKSNLDDLAYSENLGAIAASSMLPPTDFIRLMLLRRN